MVGRECVSPLEEVQCVGLVAAQHEVGHLPHRLDVIGVQFEAATKGVLRLLVAAGKVKQMAKEIEHLNVVRLRLGRFFQRLDGLVVAVEHREAAAEQEQGIDIGLVPREELLRQLGGLGEVAGLGPFGGLEQQRL